MQNCLFPTPAKICKLVGELRVDRSKNIAVESADLTPIWSDDACKQRTRTILENRIYQAMTETVVLIEETKAGTGNFLKTAARPGPEIAVLILANIPDVVVADIV